MTQSEVIKIAIIGYLDKGLRDKREIFTKVVDDLGVPRPTVRRCSRELAAELSDKVKILTSDLEQMKNS